MLYLLGGAARSGKSIIARRILVEKRIPFFCLDHLAHAAARTIPQLHIDLDSDDATVGEQLWPLAKSVASMIIKNKMDYLLEGALLQPRNAHELMSEFPGIVHASFVGYAEAQILEKFSQVRQYGGTPDDWMMNWDDESVRKELERLKGVSESLRSECAKYQIMYFETSHNFDQAVNDVMEYLAPGEC